MHHPTETRLYRDNTLLHDTTAQAHAHAHAHAYTCLIVEKAAYLICLANYTRSKLIDTPL